MPTTSNLSLPASSCTAPSARSTAGIGALIRHEWRLNGRNVWILIAAQAAIILMHLILAQLPLSWSTGIAFYIIAIMHVFGIVASLAIIAVVAAILLISYYQSMHGQYAAFTVAVPVRTGTHLLIKTLWAYVAFVVSAAMGVLGLLVGTTELSGRLQFGAQGMDWPSSWEFLRSAIEANLVLIILCIIGVALVLMLLVCEGVFIVTVGSSAKFSRHGFAVGVLLAIVTTWLIRNGFMAFGLLAVPFGVKFTYTSPSATPEASFTMFNLGTASFENVLPLGLFAALIVAITFFWGCTYRQLAKHWSL